MTTRSDVEKLRVHRSEDLCLLAEMFGYRSKGRYAINQLQCNNGSFVSSLLSMLDDNPDLMETMKDWVMENLEMDEEEEEDEDECEEEDGDGPQ